MPIPTGLPTGNPAIFDQIPQPYLANQNPTWFRYSNGLMECWGTVATGTMSTANGSQFKPASDVTVTYPQAFTEAPHVVVTVAGTNCAGATWNTNTTTGVKITPLANITGASGTIYWVARGPWI